MRRGDSNNGIETQNGMVPELRVLHLLYKTSGGAMNLDWGKQPPTVRNPVLIPPYVYNHHSLNI